MPFCDDVALQGDIELGRVLVDRNWYTLRDDGSERPTSAAFIDSSNETSCFIIAETDLNLIAGRFPGRKLGIVTVAAAREAGVTVRPDPEGGGGVPGHVFFFQDRGLPTSKKHTPAGRELAHTGRAVSTPRRAPD